MKGTAFRGLQMAIGVWLMFAPAALGYGDPAQANDRIFGPIAGSLAFVALWEIARSLRWAIVPVAGWLVVAPLVLWYPDAVATVNSIACGLVLAATTAPGGVRADAYGGGWRSLTRSGGTDS